LIFAGVSGADLYEFEGVAVAGEAVEISRLMAVSLEDPDDPAAFGDDIVGFDEAVPHGAGRIIAVDAREIVEVIKATTPGAGNPAERSDREILGGVVVPGHERVGV